MTTVELGAVFLNLASDLSDFQAFDSPTGLVVSTGRDGGVRTLANGRTRIVTRAGTPQTVSLSLEYLTREQIDWLTAHVGELMCVRDHLGRKLYGAYFDATAKELAYVSVRGDIDVQFTKVTHSESV